MSRKSQKRKLNDKHRHDLAMKYWDAYHQWRRREPPLWRIFAHYKWKQERPYKPKWIDERDLLLDKYHYIRCLRG